MSIVNEVSLEIARFMIRMLLKLWGVLTIN